MPATAITSRTRSFRRATCWPRGAPIPRPRSIPALASLVAKHHGANHPAMPPYVAFMKSQIAPGVRRIPGQAVRSVHRQPGDRAAGLYQRRRGYGHDRRRRDVSVFAGRQQRPPERPARAVGGFRSDAGRPRSGRLDGRPGPLSAASGRDAARPPRPGGLRPDARAGRRRATATASICGASRRWSRGGWSKRASRS